MLGALLMSGLLAAAFSPDIAAFVRGQLGDDEDEDGFRDADEDHYISLSLEALKPVDPDIPDEPGGDELGSDPIGWVDPDATDPGGGEIEGDPLDPLEEDRAGSALAGVIDEVMGADVPPETTELGPGDDVFALPDDPAADPGALELRDGAPLVTSTEAVSIVDAGDGQDSVTTGSGAAYVFGGAGDDALALGDGAGAAFGGTGDDTLTGSDDAGAVLQHYLSGDLGDDVIAGGAAGEYLDGGVHGELAAGESDDDRIDGGGGDDVIRGGAGADELSGGAGDDVVDHFGHDALRAGEEGAVFARHTDGAADVLDGGAGNDTLVMDGQDTATGGSGADTFLLYSEAAHVAEVTDFVPGEDVLKVTLAPDYAGALEWDVRSSEDGADGLVTVDGHTVAVLRGAPGATVFDVWVERDPAMV